MMDDLKLQVYLLMHKKIVAIDFETLCKIGREEDPLAMQAELIKYKTGSWKTMKDFIFEYCFQNCIPVPSGFIDLWKTQHELEQIVLKGARRYRFALKLESIFTPVTIIGLCILIPALVMFIWLITHIPK